MDVRACDLGWRPALGGIRNDTSGGRGSIHRCVIVVAGRREELFLHSASKRQRVWGERERGREGERERGREGERERGSEGERERGERERGREGERGEGRGGEGERERGREGERE